MLMAMGNIRKDIYVFFSRIPKASESNIPLSVVVVLL